MRGESGKEGRKEYESWIHFFISILTLKPCSFILTPFLLVNHEANPISHHSKWMDAGIEVLPRMERRKEGRGREGKKEIRKKGKRGEQERRRKMERREGGRKRRKEGRKENVPKIKEMRTGRVCWETERCVGGKGAAMGWPDSLMPCY